MPVFKSIKENEINDIVSSLTTGLSLDDYKIVWNDGERSIPEIWMLHPSRRFTYFALLSLYDFATRFTKDKSVLDFGCGVGYGSYYLASRKAQSVLGIEIDDKSYRYSIDRYQRTNLKFLDVPVEELAANKEYKNKFDVIFCSNVMEHIEDYKNALSSVTELLAPNGLYIQITPPSGRANGNPYHVTNYTVPQWREILSEFFDKQRYFAHIAEKERNDTDNEFDFKFEQCQPEDMGPLKSISGIIVCEL